MKIDGNQILARLAATKKTDREKISLYLSRSLHKAFKEACGDIPASKVMEELIIEFLSSIDSKTSRGAKR